MVGTYKNIGSVYCTIYNHVESPKYLEFGPHYCKLNWSEAEVIVSTLTISEWSISIHSGKYDESSKEYNVLKSKITQYVMNGKG